MKFYRELYWGESMSKNRSKVKRKLKTNAGQLQIYVITLAQGGGQLDIIHCAYLQQAYYKKHPPFIVGIAKGYDEALLVLQKILSDVLERTGTADMKRFIISNSV